MPHAVPKAEAPLLNKAARQALYRAQRLDRLSDANLLVRDGFEVFVDQSYYDMLCVRPQGARDFSDTVHVGQLADAEALVDWLAGRREDIPFKLLDAGRDQAVLDQWRAAGIQPSVPAM